MIRDVLWWERSGRSLRYRSLINNLARDYKQANKDWHPYRDRFLNTAVKMAALHTKGISRSNKINVFWDKYGITLKDNYTVPVLALLDERLRPTPVIQPGILIKIPGNHWSYIKIKRIKFLGIKIADLLNALHLAETTSKQTHLQPGVARGCRFQYSHESEDMCPISEWCNKSIKKVNGISLS